jgi:hypothetical protein
MILYLAGPMSGLPDSNYPAFHAAAAALRTAGHTVLNPAESPPEASWLDYMFSALRLIGEGKPDAVVMLSGWGSSWGAQTERTLFVNLKLPVYHQNSREGVFAVHGLLL